MGDSQSDRWRIRPGGRLSLAKIDTASTDGTPGNKATTVTASAKLHTRLADLQTRLYAEDTQALLVVLQAMDAGGKDGTIKHVMTGMNPQGVQVVSFKAPTGAELTHDFLWRVHANVPAKGRVGVFNRSHYEDVLVVRVHKLVPERVWRSRYDSIREFEELLTRSRTRIVKCFLHISKDEQKRRFQERLDTPSKRWKFRRADLDERALWDEYQAAFEDAIAETTTRDAPWYAIPADHEWYRNWAVTTILVETLERMDPQYPEPEDPTRIEIV